METTEITRLPLFETEVGSKQKAPLISSNQVVTQAVNELEKVKAQTPETLKPTGISETTIKNLDDLFPEQRREEKAIKSAKEILGELASQYTQEQLKNVVTEIQFLAESWLDDFEREIFKGKTLRELLHDNGGA